MNDDLFLFIRNGITRDARVSTLNDRNELTLNRDQLAEAMTSTDNVSRLANQIVARADPTRSEVSQSTLDDITTKVETLLSSWKTLGKFDRAFLTVNNKQFEITTASMGEMMNFYNNEFINSFAESILPTSDITAVKSVLNPNGMFAQQERIEMVRSKPVHFHERSVFRRLNTWDHERPMDETQALFYGMDKKTSDTSDTSDTINKQQDTTTYLDRETPTYRMNPNY
jgi:hypothetical protein